MVNTPPEIALNVVVNQSGTKVPIVVGPPYSHSIVPGGLLVMS